MEIARHTQAAVIVSSEWRHLGVVKLVIGPPDTQSAAGDGSSLIQGQILEATDERGIWIELDSGQKKGSDRSAQKLMVPWRFVLAIALQPDLEPHEKKIGYETSEPVPA